MHITNKDECPCQVCIEGKMCQFRSKKADKRAGKPLEYVHCDLAGPVYPVAGEDFEKIGPND